jgi:hypothetical protein
MGKISLLHQETTSRELFDKGNRRKYNRVFPGKAAEGRAQSKTLTRLPCPPANAERLGVRPALWRFGTRRGI